MAEILAKLSGFRERASGAVEDVPDNLIGTVIALLLFTILGLGILVLLGYWATQ